jgi:hypothetical protein
MFELFSCGTEKDYPVYTCDKNRASNDIPDCYWQQIVDKKRFPGEG